MLVKPRKRMITDTQEQQFRVRRDRRESLLSSSPIS